MAEIKRESEILDENIIKTHEVELVTNVMLKINIGMKDKKIVIYWYIIDLWWVEGKIS